MYNRTKERKTWLIWWQLILENPLFLEKVKPVDWRCIPLRPINMLWVWSSLIKLLKLLTTSNCCFLGLRPKRFRSCSWLWKKLFWRILRLFPSHCFKFVIWSFHLKLIEFTYIVLLIYTSNTFNKFLNCSWIDLKHRHWLQIILRGPFEMLNRVRIKKLFMKYVELFFVKFNFLARADHRKVIKLIHVTLNLWEIFINHVNFSANMTEFHWFLAHVHELRLDILNVSSLVTSLSLS